MKWIELLLIGLLLAGLALTRGTVGQAQEILPDPIFIMDAQFNQLNQDYTVPVWVATNVGVRWAQFDLSFDPTIIQVLSVDEGTFLNSLGSTHVTPALIDNTRGRITGFSVRLTGAPGQAATTSAPFAQIRYHTIKNGKFNAQISNMQFTDVNGAYITPTVFIGGFIQVGPGADLTVYDLKLSPAGLGKDFGKTFDVTFVIKNNGPVASDPTTAVISVDGGSPGYTRVDIASIGANSSQTYTYRGFTMTASAAVVTVGVATDGNRTATYQFFPATDSGSTQLDATNVAYLKVNPPALITFSSETMKLGSNQIASSLNVQCNTYYQVDVLDNDPLTAWHLREWDGSVYKDRRMADPLRVTNPAQGLDVTLGTPSKIASGSVAGQNADLGQDFPISFVQTLHFADAVLPTGETYHNVLTFNSYVTM